MSRRIVIFAGLAVALASVGVVAVVRPTAAALPPVVGPGRVVVDLGIEHSRFTRSVVRVREGTTLTFRVRNGDPMGHELIVGDAEVHARHERGHEAGHPPVAGEVSVPPLATVSTTYAFAPGGPSTVVFACHLPGHLAYGMRGEVRVIPA